MYFRIVYIFLLSVLSLASFFSDAQIVCEDIFGSRLYYDNKVLEHRADSALFHPKFEDIVAERELQKKWNEKPIIPRLLKFLLPRGVHFIKRQLYQPGHASAVKLGEWGEEIIARAHYKHGDRVFHTNVAFSRRALFDNLNDGAKQNWLVGKNAKAAILFLHGGGTKSTGFHVGGQLISRFRHFDVDVVSIDLPWHAQGHREFVNAEVDIKIIGSFVKKYIPPNVPLFVVGHSWGSVYAEILMRMTDRPPEELSFHNNLKGVMILSTAQDAARGKSRQEKYAAYFKRLKESKRRSHTEAPESELHIFTNIVRDGKTSALGGAYSMNVISYLDQTTPEHKGRKYIPALMLVGKRDSLVYFGFEDLYEVYKELVNVETHYLEGEMPHVSSRSKEPVMQGVGHDVFSVLDPNNLKGREPIVYGIMRRFIAKQLELDSLKSNLIKDVKLSGIGESFEGEIINQIREIKSFSEFRLFINTNPGVRKALGSELINDIGRTATRLESSADLQKVNLNKLQVHPLIRLMQLTANDLAFREFLKDFIHYEDNKTSTYISYIKVGRKTHVENISRALSQYNSYVSRIKYLLDRLLTTEDMSDLTPLIREIDAVIDVAFKEIEHGKKSDNTKKDDAKGRQDVLKKINNEKLKIDLIQLREKMAEEADSNNMTMEEIQQTARKILGKNDSFFAPLKHNKPSKKISGLLGLLLAAKDLEQVKSIIEKERLPRTVERNVIEAMREYLVSESLIAFEYVPQMKDFEGLNMTNKQKERVAGIIHKLSSIIESRKKREKENSSISAEQQQLRDKYEELLKIVKHNIKALKDVFKEASYQPPPSLVEAHNRSAEELNGVERAIEKMDKALDEVFKAEEELSDLQITEMLNSRREDIDNFINLYEQYVQNRHSLRQELIVAGERGDMGVELQETITSLYGHGSEGRTSVVGADNQYEALKKVTIQLAVVEAKMHNLERLRIESSMEYTSLMNALMNILGQYVSNSSGIKEVDNLIKDASNLSKIVEYPLLGVLNGEHGNIPLNGANREQVIEYIGDYKKVFSEAASKWDNLRSKVPPLLPTASD